MQRTASAKDASVICNRSGSESSESSAKFGANRPCAGAEFLTAKHLHSHRHPHFCSSAPNINLLPKDPSQSRLRRSNSDGALLDLETLRAQLDTSMRFMRSSTAASAEDDPDPLLKEIRSLPTRQGGNQQKDKSVLGKLKGLVLRKSKSEGNLLENYTYVCTTSRMMHNSNGMDASVIDMF